MPEASRTEAYERANEILTSGSQSGSSRDVINLSARHRAQRSRTLGLNERQAHTMPAGTRGGIPGDFPLDHFADDGINAGAALVSTAPQRLQYTLRQIDGSPHAK